MANEERNHLFEENKGLVYHIIATKYSTFKDKDDLQQEGFIALWKAAICFNVKMHNNFGAYATISICRRLNKYLRKQSKNFSEVLFSDIDKENQVESLCLDNTDI